MQFFICILLYLYIFCKHIIFAIRVYDFVYITRYYRRKKICITEEPAVVRLRHCIAIKKLCLHYKPLSCVKESGAVFVYRFC